MTPQRNSLNSTTTGIIHALPRPLASLRHPWNLLLAPWPRVDLKDSCYRERNVNLGTSCRLKRDDAVRGISCNFLSHCHRSSPDYG
jgi:hypothetical protein